jgi:hypothetical protein
MKVGSNDFLWRGNVNCYEACVRAFTVLPQIVERLLLSVSTVLQHLVSGTATGELVDDSTATNGLEFNYSVFTALHHTTTIIHGDHDDHHHFLTHGA